MVVASSPEYVQNVRTKFTQRHRPSFRLDYRSFEDSSLGARNKGM